MIKLVMIRLPQLKTVLLVLIVPTLLEAGILPGVRDGSNTPAHHDEKSCSSAPGFSKIHELDQDLAAILPGTSVLPQQAFVSHILKTYEIKTGSDVSHTRITLRLKPADWGYYLALQQEIAKLIPEESKRPTIDLAVTNTSSNTARASIGIAGGTGPLSDSELLKLIMESLNSETNRKKKLDWNQFAINLYSAPPPRNASEGWSRGISYVEGLTGFATRGHDKYFLASNTAHSKMSNFRELVSLTILRRGIGQKEGAVVDLVDYVASQVASKDDVLILGTLRAYKDHLYPNYLSKRGLRAADLSVDAPSSSGGEAQRSLGNYYTVENLERATELQGLIDLAKEGNIEEVGDKVRDFIIREVKRIEASQRSLRKVKPIKIILGCTELPMALRGDIMNRLNYELQKTLPQKNSKRKIVPIQVLNTENLFARKIVGEIRTLF